jgi:hypothetical protein
LYEPTTSDQVNLVIKKQVLMHADLTNHPRGWNSGPTLDEYSFHPITIFASDHKARTLGTRMVEEGLGWDGHTVEYVHRPRGYIDWGICVLNNHSFLFERGRGEHRLYMWGHLLLPW